MIFIVTNNGSGHRKIDIGDEGRLKYGPVKRKSKSNRPSFDQVKTSVQCDLMARLFVQY